MRRFYVCPAFFIRLSRKIVLDKVHIKKDKYETVEAKTLIGSYFTSENIVEKKNTLKTNQKFSFTYRFFEPKK